LAVDERTRLFADSAVLDGRYGIDGGLVLVVPLVSVTPGMLGVRRKEGPWLNDGCGAYGRIT
jgi:hypothetical protein